MKESRTRSVAQSHFAAAKFAFQCKERYISSVTVQSDTHSNAVQSRATRYTHINYKLPYCLVQFLNRKGHDLKHALHVVRTVRVLEWWFIIKLLGLRY